MILEIILKYPELLYLKSISNRIVASHKKVSQII